MDHALRTLVAELQPYGLTKAEVVMILNLGVGVDGSGGVDGERVGEEDGEGGEDMDVDGDGDGHGGVNGHGNANRTDEMNGEQQEGDGEEEEEGEDGDYGALALLDTVIEDREERLSDEDVVAVLAIIRRTLGLR